MNRTEAASAPTAPLRTRPAAVASGHLEFGRVGRALAAHRGAVLVAWCVAVAAAVVASFPSYWAGVVGA